ncbi:twin-arginine translocase subunit TatC [Haloferax profundi]|uniref:Sec-independent protein translocase protein TatC n=1 Tax=Haloferax profundi TaxID=1544718 RepID=A0A0W1SSV7_9EURY|nr:twin-arginine translocase subunit TatC [Haloferax profundi]KTG29397.1 preprotein translocase subunit TatC [Haloferax profundi]
MADEERDAESSPPDETHVSDDAGDTDSVSRGDDSDGEPTSEESHGGDSSGDGAQPATTEPVYGRVTPREETVSDEPADADEREAPDAESDDTSDDAGGDDASTEEVDTTDDGFDDEFEDDDDDTLVVGDPDAPFEEDEHFSHVPEGTYDDDAGGDAESEDDSDRDEDIDGDRDEHVDTDGEDASVATSDSTGAIDAETAPGGDDLLDDGIAGSAPESDQEMPLTDHIEEMIRRLAVVFGVAGLITLILFPGADILNAYVNTGLPSATDVINFLWNTHIPAADAIADRRPRLYGPLELILTKLKVAGLAGTVIGLPVFVYETYLFMRPGLYPKERKYYLAAVPTSLVLALIGVTFAHFVVLPAIFAYFTSYTEGTAVIAFGLKETFNLILILMGYMAIVFQIPLFVELAIMMKLVTREWLENRRLLFWGAFLGLAFLVSPDPTGMAPIIIAATMITLFEGTLAVLRWTGN